MGSTSSSSASTFVGNSSFSSDFQQVITRAVSIASLPLAALQNQQNSLNNQQSALQSLSSNFQSLQTSVDGLNNAVGAGSFSANVSSSTVATAYTSSGVTAGNYSLNVTSIGSHTNTMSTDGLTTVTDPSSGNIDSATAYTLTVDGTDYQISPSGSSLNALVSAINASSANVQATVVNVGGSSSPDYRLSVQGTKYANNNIQLSDGTNSLLNTVSSGSNVTYQINGQTSNISSDSRSITLAPNLTVNLLQTGSTDITVAQNTSAISSALTSFANAYNNAVDELAKSHGANAGALAGQSIIFTLSSSLRQIFNSGNPSGSINSLADLGLTFGQDGHLSFDASVLSKASANSMTNVLNFLGSESSSGFLQSAKNILTSINDSTTGSLPVGEQVITDGLSSLADKMSATQDRITLLQQNLTDQMSKADALVAGLQQQVSYFTSMFAAMRQNNNNND